MNYCQKKRSFGCRNSNSRNRYDLIAVVSTITTKQTNRKNYLLNQIIRVLYFLTYYSILMLFMFGYMHGLMYFLVKRDYPTLTGLHTALRLNPGLSILPQPNWDTSLIHITTSRSASTEAIFAQLLAFVVPYYAPNHDLELDNCFSQFYVFDIRRACAFDLHAAGPCNVWSGFNFDSYSPCLILKMNKIYGWLPDPIPYASGVVVKCEGATPEDTRIIGDIRYFDLHNKLTSSSENFWKGNVNNGTFPSQFFPYLNQPNYQQPLVFVLFDSIKRNSLARVNCFLIAKNIQNDISRAEGAIAFELLVD